MRGIQWGASLRMPVDHELRRAVASAYAFFDVLDHPLTPLEAWRFRRGCSSATLKEVESAIRALGLEERNGYFFLPGREEIVAARARRYRATEPKLRRAAFAARLLRLLPSVRLVAVCNSIALTGSDDGGDIDFFVVVAPGTIWATRLFAVGALHLLGLRPTNERHKDAFCMSFFAAEDALDLSRFALAGDDPYLRYWLMTLIPLYDAGGVMDGLFAANRTLLDVLPGVRAVAPTRHGARGAPRLLAPLLRILRKCESSAKAWQLPRLPADIRERMNADTRIVVSDSVLKFHMNDRRAAFAAFAAERLAILDAAMHDHHPTTTR